VAATDAMAASALDAVSYNLSLDLEIHSSLLTFFFYAKNLPIVLDLLSNRMSYSAYSLLNRVYEHHTFLHSGF
jgi:hypothetical protein